MEEKERYKLESHNGTFCEFHDTETDEWYIRKDLVTDLLNQQDKEIIKLREENKKLCRQIIDLNKENNKLREFRDDILRVQSDPYQFYKENQQLKEAQKQLAIEELEKSQKKWEEKDTLIEQLQAENKLLKVGMKGLDDLLKSQAKEIVKEIEKNFTEYLPLKDKTGAGFYSRLNSILKKYGGEDE